VQRMHAYCADDRRVRKKVQYRTTGDQQRTGLAAFRSDGAESIRTANGSARTEDGRKPLLRHARLAVLNASEARDKAAAPNRDFLALPWRTEPQLGRRTELRNRRKWHASQRVTPERFREGMRREPRTGPGHVTQLTCSYPLVGTAGQTELIRPSAYHASSWTRVGAPQQTGVTERHGTGSRTTVRHEPHRHRADGCGGRPQGRGPPGSRPRGSRPCEVNRDTTRS
jgi:hypothetical protein